MTKGLAAASTGDAEARAREKLLQQKLDEQTQQFAEQTKVPETHLLFNWAFCSDGTESAAQWS